jgi:hypothetical protein
MQTYNFNLLLGKILCGNAWSDQPPRARENQEKKKAGVCSCSQVGPAPVFSARRRMGACGYSLGVGQCMGAHAASVSVWCMQRVEACGCAVTGEKDQ